MNILDPIDVEIEIFTGSGTSLLSIGLLSARIIWTPFGSKAKRYGNPGGPTTLMDLGVGDFFDLEIWGAGGGSIDPFTFGGPSSRARMSFVLDEPIQNLQIRVGTKGSKTALTRCTGGRSTVVILNGIRVCDIGGGGGSAEASHGGAVGGPRDAALTPENQAMYAYSGYSGSSEPFTSLDSNLTQVLGPHTSGPHGAGAALGVSGDDGSLDVNGQAVAGGLGGLGGQGALGYGTSLLFDSPETITGGDGTGPIGTNAFGAGGGGSTTLLNAGQYATFSISNCTLNPPWVSKNGGPPQGGGYGPYVSGGQDYFEPVQTYCNNVSAMSLVLTRLWPVQQQLAWTTSVLANIASYVATGGSLAAPDSANNLVWASDDVFVNNALNPPDDVNAGPLTSYLPLGPHDRYFPGQGGPNVRPITNDLALLDLNTTLCVHNDGQVLASEIPYLLDTSFAGPGVPEGTLVTSIRIAASRPQGLYSAIYLGLSEPIANANGPFVWSLVSSAPGNNLSLGNPMTFTHGTPIHGTLKLLAMDQTVQFPVASPLEASEFCDAIYDAIAHMYINPYNYNSSGPPLFNADFTLPSDDPGGPQYLNQVWPATTPNGARGDLIGLRVFIKQADAPPQASFGHQKSVQSFEYTGAVQQMHVPSWARQVNILTFGAGGSSASETQSGSGGSFVFFTHRDLKNAILEVHVGQAGSPADSHVAPVSGLCGGLCTTPTSVTAVGGGFSGVKLNSEWLVIAAGGGSAGLVSNGVREPTPDSKSVRSRNDGLSGALVSQVGSDAVDSTSGAGGSGYRGGSAGKPGFSGAAGRSLVPKNAVLSGNLEKQRFWTPEIGVGATSKASAGFGRVVFEILY